MDFATVSELRAQSGKVWKKVAAGEEIVITRRGRPVALLVRAKPSEVHNTLRALRASAFQSALRRQHSDSVRSGLDKMTMEEIDAEIAVARKTARERGTSGS